MKKESTVETDIFKTKRWYVNGLLHREDGPAVECVDGFKAWFFLGKKHRLNGPAEEDKGYKSWWVNGKLHRIDGPAVENEGGRKLYYIYGKQYSFEEWDRLRKIPWLL